MTGNTITPAKISNTYAFNDALRLFPTVEAVVEHNINKFHACGQPVATIKAVHSGPNDSKGYWWSRASSVFSQGCMSHVVL